MTARSFATDTDPLSVLLSVLKDDLMVTSQREGSQATGTGEESDE